MIVSTSEAVAPVRLRRRAKKKLGLAGWLKKYGPIYLFMVPTFILLLTFTYYPVISALVHSVFRWDGVNAKFVGLAHFRQMLTVDRAFITSLGNVVRLTVFRVGVALTVPLLAAEVIFSIRNSRMAYIWRVLLVIPMVVPWVVLILVWLFIYDPQMGVINTSLRGLGLESWTRLWLGDTRLALWCIAFFNFPWVSGLNLLIYLAGLDSIPPELFDAAAIDGAGRLRRVFNVDIPMIMGQLKLIFIMTIITQLQSFQDIMIFSNGGPGQSTFVPGLVLYHSAFYYGKMGYASAIGVFLFAIIFVISMINQRLIRSSVEYVPEG